MGKILRRVEEKMDRKLLDNYEEKFVSIKDNKIILEEIKKLHSYFENSIMKEELDKALHTPNKNEKSILSIQLGLISAIKEVLLEYPVTRQYWIRYWELLGKKKIEAVKDEYKNKVAPESQTRMEKIIKNIKVIHGI